MADSPKQTSDEVSSLAGKVLADPDSSKIAKRLAASALTQGDSPGEGTSPEVASDAARALARGRSSSTVKTLAGSVLGQTEPAGSKPTNASQKTGAAPRRTSGPAAPKPAAPKQATPKPSAPRTAPPKSSPGRKR